MWARSQTSGDISGSMLRSMSADGRCAMSASVRARTAARSATAWSDAVSSVGRIERPYDPRSPPREGADSNSTPDNSAAYGTEGRRRGPTRDYDPAAAEEGPGGARRGGVVAESTIDGHAGEVY